MCSNPSSHLVTSFQQRMSESFYNYLILSVKMLKPLHTILLDWSAASVFSSIHPSLIHPPTDPPFYPWPSLFPPLWLLSLPSPAEQWTHSVPRRAPRQLMAVMFAPWWSRYKWCRQFVLQRVYLMLGWAGWWGLPELIGCGSRGHWP